MERRRDAWQAAHVALVEPSSKLGNLTACVTGKTGKFAGLPDRGSSPCGLYFHGHY
jgi:hypothetical protein